MNERETIFIFTRKTAAAFLKAYNLLYEKLNIFNDFLPAISRHIKLVHKPKLPSFASSENLKSWKQYFFIHWFAFWRRMEVEETTKMKKLWHAHRQQFQSLNPSQNEMSVPQIFKKNSISLNLPSTDMFFRCANFDKTKLDRNLTKASQNQLILQLFLPLRSTNPLSSSSCDWVVCLCKNSQIKISNKTST